MAEPFGIVSGAVGIASVFTTCVDCFNYVQLGRHFGRDYQTSALELQLMQLRVSRWGQAVDVYDDPQLGNPKATTQELQTAKDTLFQILTLFASTEKTSNDFKLSSGSKSGDLLVFEPRPDDKALLVLGNRMKDLAVKRQKGASLLKTTKWALYSGAEFQRVIDSITRLMEALEKAFPAPERQAALVAEEVNAFPGVEQRKVMETIASGLDELLRQQATKAITTSKPGHVYNRVIAKNKAKMLNGDLIAAGWTGPTNGPSHTYNDIQAENEAQVLNGNSYGGSFFG